ncbi:MAG: hypothetical protein F2588_01015 [Actinobacteria bacterium]|nr:hypothetical protein [Actinomycetota bacterium]
MKRILIILSVVFLAMVIIPGARAGSAVTPGSKCTESGLQIIYKSKIFTCVKTGSKLVWDKGKQYPPVNSSPSPTVISAPTPTQSEAAKVKADAKLCKPAAQAALRAKYTRLNEYWEFFEKYYPILEQMNMYVRNGSGDSEIQVKTSEFEEALRPWPSTGQYRNVPVRIYRAVLDGRLTQNQKLWNLTTSILMLDYKSASAGCRKVVGPPVAQTISSTG